MELLKSKPKDEQHLEHKTTMAEQSAATMEGTDAPPMPPVAEEGTSEGPPRLMITKMELENFKSYAGVREIGPFHKCFSAVVGPNGSGKSNVIDAMLFVFGKRAKKLRLNKVSELIHKSDAVKDNPPTAARVSVFFQEIVDTSDTEYKVIPNTETVVTRIARKDNSSTYKLDGKNCQFRDVAAFLNGKGIDLDNNRFLILQGEVEMISMMPPKGKTEAEDGLLEYLEDIIGSHKYVEETNLTAEKMEALTDQRQEKLHRVKAVEKEKDALESAKAEAEALLGKERDIRRQKNVLVQLNQLQVTRDVEKLKGKQTKVQEKLEGERSRLQQANERVQEIEAGLSAERKAYDKVFKELTKTKEEFAAYERRDIKLREELKHGKAQKKKLQKKVEKEQGAHEQALAKGEKSQESIPQLEEQIVELKEQKVEEDSKLEVIYDEMKEKTHKLRSDLEIKSQELAPVKQERAVFQAALDTAQTEVQLLEDSTTRAKERLTAAELELASLDQQQEAKRQELTACEQEVTDAQERIAACEQEGKVLAEQEGQLAKRHQNLLARSEEAKAALQFKSGGRSPAVKGILKAARKGGELSKAGVVGRLGDLASISEKYDIAVSTACGMLDYIVVHTTAGAQKCLEFLRKHNLGRANFVPLDKMKKGAHDQVVDTPENAPRLFELISPSNFAITPALFLAVGNTLVAPDLETATRWAYDFRKRWRVVTLDGKLIETAGTMAGGGKNVRRGGMKLTNPRAAARDVNMDDETESMDAQKLEEEAAKAQNLLQECRARRRELTEEARTLKRRLKELEIKLPKLSMEINGCDTTRAELTKLIPELRTRCELSDDDAAKLAGLQDKVEKCKSDMASCAELANQLETEVARLQKAILEAGGSKLKKQQTKCEKVLEDLNSTEKALKTAHVTIKSSEKAAAKALKAKEVAETELEECKATAEAKQEEFKALEEDALKVMQAYESVKAIEEEKRSALEAAVQECEDLKQSESDVKVVEVELLGQVAALKKQLAECSQKQKHWKNELDKLRTQETDEYGLELEQGEKEPSKDMEKSDSDEEMENAEEPAAECFSESSLPILLPETLDKYSKEQLKEDIAVLEMERAEIAKNANMGAIAEYRKKEADYQSRVEELDAVTEERNAVRLTHEELRRKRLEMFMDGFGQITLKLKEMYQMITLGGDAELELVDSLDPFSEGIVFSVRPPKKSWKNISNLSGGEKTLSSLALVFALHHFKPTPLYVMDEIDAALDFKNVSIVANYIKERTKNAQFIIISLRNNMFELADRLVGIYKTNNCTKSITINPDAFGVNAQQNGHLTSTPALGDRSNRNKSQLSALKSVERRVSFGVMDAPESVSR